MTPDSAIITGAGTIQLVGLALLVIMVIIMGMRVVGQGPKGFASLLGEVIGLFVAVYVIMRPNDTLSLLSHTVGGVQTPALPK